jgi:hypothetical protein
MMNRYRYGGLSTPGLYLDETTMRMCYTHRRLFGQLALHLIADNKKDKALKVLRKAEQVIPTYNVPMNYMSGGTDIARAYALLGQTAKAKEVLSAVWKDAMQYEEYYLSLDGARFQGAQRDCMIQLSIMSQVADITSIVDKSLAAKQKAQLDNYYRLYLGKGGQVMENR